MLRVDISDCGIALDCESGISGDSVPTVMATPHWERRSRVGLVTKPAPSRSTL